MNNGVVVIVVWFVNRYHRVLYQVRH